MKIYVHTVGGTILDFHGLADHLSFSENLEKLGFEVFDDNPLPRWCGNESAMCVRFEDGEYEEGKYDVAEMED